MTFGDIRQIVKFHPCLNSFRPWKLFYLPFHETRMVTKANISVKSQVQTIFRFSFSDNFSRDNQLTSGIFSISRTLYSDKCPPRFLFLRLSLVFQEVFLFCIQYPCTGLECLPLLFRRKRVRRTLCKFCSDNFFSHKRFFLLSQKRFFVSNALSFCSSTLRVMVMDLWKNCIFVTGHALLL